jgi:hypothetical protein
MVVMLEVGGLAPGEYPVGISDPALVGRGGHAPSAPNAAGEQPTVAQPAGGNQLPAGGNPVTEGDTSSANATGTTNQVTPPATPPTGQVDPPTTAPTGQVNPPLTPATGRVDATPPPTASVTGSRQSGTLPHVGTLTIDQSGEGSLQQVVDGVLVRDVLGKAIVIYASADSPQTVIPANPIVPQTKADTAARQSQPSSPQPGAVDAPQAPGRGQHSDVAAQPPENPRVPVAAGLIRLFSEHRPITATANDTPTNQPVPPAQPQPAATEQLGSGGDPISRPITR